MQHQQKPPLFLFQMGKVGSSSLKATLPSRYKGEVVHAHNYGHMSQKEQKMLNEHKQLNLPINVITPIRNPLSRNISAFFQNFERDTGYKFSDKSWSLNELRDLFLQCCRHNVCLEWFDNCMRRTFDFDVFANTFLIEKKWSTYKNGSIRFLIYRCDLERSQQLSIISEFLGCEINSWVYANISEQKEYAIKYQDFCDSITLPDIYIKIMCDSKFSKHFWSGKEIVNFSKKWRSSES